MAVINYSKKEISVKIVYYGPSLCGKTTNLQQIYTSVMPEQKGKLVSLATDADRTLFFDFLPIEVDSIKGFKTRLHFYTVPGQVYYNSTRRAVLTGVDGIVFVADSQNDKMEENLQSLANLEDNLHYYGKSLKTIPFVFQYNKQDLPTAMKVEEINQILNQAGNPTVEAIAVTGQGVMQTLTKITKMVLRHVEKSASASQPQQSQSLKEKLVPPRQQESATHSATEPERVPTPPIATVSLKKEHGFTGGVIKITGTGNASIISANAVSLPLKIKIGEDDRTYKLDVAIRVERIVCSD